MLETRDRTLQIDTTIELKDYFQASFDSAKAKAEVKRGKSFIHVAWENVRKVIERPRYFRFDLNQYESVIIPKRFLLHGADEQVMKEILVSSVRNKAKLLR